MGILADPKVRAIRIIECGETMEELSVRDFLLEPMYFKWGYSETSIIKLRSGVIDRLREAKKILNEMPGCAGWNFKIWDGFRTLKTQTILYENYLDELRAKNPEWSDELLRDAVEIFVAPPSRNKELPAPHNTGGAVDLTIVDGDGNEIEMGTLFDEFDVKSYTSHFALSEDEKGKFFHANRMLLKDVLESVGFTNYHEEWWHFSYGDQNWAASKGLSEAIYGSVEL